MKRLSLLIAVAALGGGSFLITAPAAGASPQLSGSSVVPASGSPPKVVLTAVQTPTLPRVTVRPGDTLWSIGIRYHRSWPALAAYNRIPNADLIYVGQTVTIPPASYVGVYTPPAPLRVSAPSAPVHVQYMYAPAKQQVSTPVSHTSTYHVPPVSHSYASSGSSGGFTGVWACIAQHESGGNPSTNTGNGYYGGLQFSESTWLANGGSGNPANASAAEQQRVAQNVVAASGGSYGAWPATSRMCGV